MTVIALISSELVMRFLQSFMNAIVHHRHLVKPLQQLHAHNCIKEA